MTRETLKGAGGEKAIIHQSFMSLERQLVVIYSSVTHLKGAEDTSKPADEKLGTERETGANSLISKRSVFSCGSATAHSYLFIRTESNPSYRDRRIDQTLINWGQGGSNGPFALVIG